MATTTDLVAQFFPVSCWQINSAQFFAYEESLDTPLIVTLWLDSKPQQKT